MHKETQISMLNLNCNKILYNKMLPGMYPRNDIIWITSKAFTATLASCTVLLKREMSIHQNYVLERVLSQSKRTQAVGLLLSKLPFSVHTRLCFCQCRMSMWWGKANTEVAGEKCLVWGIVGVIISIII